MLNQVHLTDSVTRNHFPMLILLKEMNVFEKYIEVAVKMSFMLL
jgi:hypothetical protein